MGLSADKLVKVMIGALFPKEGLTEWFNIDCETRRI